MIYLFNLLRVDKASLRWGFLHNRNFSTSEIMINGSEDAPAVIHPNITTSANNFRTRTTAATVEEEIMYMVKMAI